VARTPHVLLVPAAPSQVAHIGDLF
jgi:hypothetical protein